jgi:hypothetical protein
MLSFNVNTPAVFEPKPCDVCGKPIAQGSPEYEVGFSTLTFRLDADRYAIWTDEMLRS